MEDKYCAFLRGINVNGINIKMDALKEAFIKMGFRDAKTILATGNVIFTIAEGINGGQDSKSYIEEELSKYFSYDAHVIIRSSREIQEIVVAAQTMDVAEECHNYLLLCDDREMILDLKQLFDSMPQTPLEQLMVLECGVFWTVLKGSTLSSDFGSKVLGNKKYKSRLTSRNINTIQKIHKLMVD
ncbi:DUF1697 domain-containing protein [Paenibacillus sp. 19GGS1-52]|uniref:DUF1697 domain-containing protein n=1 Tax=Paenibacillus sp. 19GGS1-52 TaxID=2758563 RepID=UPI001EFBB4C4|nr:DUF1697 domain-containing protein [Paenibacillus sp. 19GGS1-52]ULO09873.1 DUF1697 domain-containing protein [Paenibacillus sp. 19GGS1-52]